jgi:hypothetical protein
VIQNKENTMKTLHLVRIFALVALVASVTACGPAGSTSSASRDSSADQLATAQHNVNLALMKANVQSVASAPSASAPAAPGCTLSAGGADPSQQVPTFQNLQDVLSSIQQDVQNQSALDADMQKFQAALLQDIGDILTQVQACIPANSSGGAALPPSTTGLGGFDISKYLGQ